MTALSDLIGQAARSARTESPIEDIALRALQQAISGAVVVPTLKAAEKLKSDTVLIIPQMRFERFRLDFGIVVGRRGKCRTFGLECDGRAYHQNHKKDNARSLFLWGCGVLVFRATGSELWRNPHMALTPLLTAIMETRLNG